MKYIAYFLLGGLYTLSFSPYNIGIFSIISVILFLFFINLDDVKSSIYKTLSYSLGYFSIGTYWLYNVIINYAEINNFLAIFLVIFFTIYLSIFFVIPMCFTLFARHKIKINENYSFIILSILITVFEIIRAHLFTGYSWFNFGQAALNTPLDYYFPVFGVHGLTFIIFLISLISINIFINKDRSFFFVLAIFLVIVYLGVYKKNWTYETGNISTISIVQPNIQNKKKYSKQDIENRMKILKNLTLSSIKNSSDIILWPEAPLPILYKNLEKNYYENILKKIPKKTTLITGSFFKNNNNIYNSIINISDKSTNVYSKRHLVPFGEFLPFRNKFSNIYKTLGINTYDITPGDSNKKFSINSLIAQPLICYESIFSSESLVLDEDVDFILNVSNDGWFGDTLAPYQHLDALAMRSLENQRYSIRSTNTGISAIINHKGVIEDYIQFNKTGIINKKIISRNGNTPLSNHGYDILYSLFFIVFLYSTVYFNIKLFRHL